MRGAKLAERMQITASTITRMAAPMEKLGLIDRHTDERDARLAFMVITDAGREKLSEACVTIAKQAGYLFEERWDEATLNQFSTELHRLESGSASNLT